MSVSPVTTPVSASNKALQTPEQKGQTWITSTASDDPARDLALRVRPVSRLDLKTEFDLSIWAVTLVIDKEFPGFHARLVIEGINEKMGSFFQIAHLQGNMSRDLKSACGWYCFTKTGKVRLYEPKPPPLRVSGYKSRTETWPRSREKVEGMIEHIRDEDEAGVVHPFSLLGRTSVFTKEMEFLETDHPVLLELQNKNPDNFVRLYSHYENSYCNNFILQKITNAVLVTPAVKLDELRVSGYLSVSYVALTLPVWFPLVMASAVVDWPRVSIARYNCDKNIDVTNLMKWHVKKISKIPDSCFTWAREKLKMIDVEMIECNSDRCAAVSTLYANKPILELCDDHEKGLLTPFDLIFY